MSEPCSLSIVTVYATGIPDIEDWGRDVCATMDKLAKSWPEEYWQFSTSSLAVLDDHTGVIVIHAVTPVAISDEVVTSLLEACGEKGSIAMCCALVEPESDDDYSGDIEKMRRIMKDKVLAEIPWLTILSNHPAEDEVLEESVIAFQLFIEFLDAQFGFADDIERFVASQRNGKIG